LASVDTRSQTSQFTVLLITEDAATCQAFTLQLAGETFCPAEPEAIASLLAKRAADIIVVAGEMPWVGQLRVKGGGALLCVPAGDSAAAEVRAAVAAGEPGAVLRALAALLVQRQSAPPAPTPPAARPAATTAQQGAAASAPGCSLPAEHSERTVAMENMLERVLNRRLR